MRILAVNKFYWPKGGAERVMFDLSEAYAAAGHEVVPFSTRSPENVPSPWEDSFAPAVRYDELGGGRALAAARNAVYSRPARAALERVLAA